MNTPSIVHVPTVTFKPEILNNGATVLMGKPVETYGGEGQRVVLAHWASNPQPYVVWTVDKSGDAFWGHYFDTIQAAGNFFLNK